MKDKKTHYNPNQDEPKPDRAGPFWTPMVIIITVAILIGIILAFLQLFFPTYQIL